MPSDSADRRNSERPADGVSYEETEMSQEEFEALLRKYDGDFQKAVDAQRRGERADDDTPASSSW